jgi:hypothetical protein
MRNYKPRRQSSRWLDADCPKGVLAILDNRGQTADRYTVIYADPIAGTAYADMYLGYRAMSENPFHPQGVGMYGEFRAHECAAYRYRCKRQYARWSDLPEKVKQCVRQDLAETA